MGHKLWVTYDAHNVPILFCIHCGRHSTIRIRKLFDTCPGKKSGRVPKSLRYLLAAQPTHPKTGVAVAKPIPAPLAHVVVTCRPDLSSEDRCAVPGRAFSSFDDPEGDALLPDSMSDDYDWDDGPPTLG